MITFFKLRCASFVLISITIILIHSGQALSRPKNNFFKQDKIPIATVVIQADKVEYKDQTPGAIALNKEQEQMYFIFENPTSEQLWVKLYSNKQKAVFFVIAPRSSYEHRYSLSKKDDPAIDVISPANNTFWLFRSNNLSDNLSKK